jgi:phytoene dehydrogenase-like protein
MLAEHGIDLRAPEDEAAEYQLLLRAFGFWDLPMRYFYSPFLHRLPAWDEQDELQRALTVLFDDLDHATEPAQKREVEERMRATVRNAIGP